MFKRIVVAAALFVVPATGFAQGSSHESAEQAPIPAFPTLAPDAARADFDLLRSALEEAHPGLNRHSTKADMDRMFQAQRGKLNAPIPAPEFEAILAQTLASIRCGHTSLNPAPQLSAAMSDAKTLPLRVLVAGGRAMVMLNDTPADSTLTPGAELLEINGHPIAQVLDRLSDHLSADGDIQTGKYHDLTGRFAHYYWWLIDRGGQFTIKARDAGGKTVTATLPGITDAQRKANHNPVNDPVMNSVGKLFHWAKEDPSVRFLKDPDIAEVRLNYFVGGNFPAALETIFKTLREKKTRSLIIDLRGNGGGKDEYGALLVSYLTDKPFRYFDRIEMKTLTPSFSKYLDGYPGLQNTLATGGTIPNPRGGFLVTPKLHPGLAQQQPAEYPFPGKVFVLTDGGTFSTAADFCAIAHHLHRATFIGEETGGGYLGNNSGPMPTLTLPNSKAQIRFPMYGYYNAVSEPELMRRGTVPDHPVELKIADVLKGIDAPLEEAVKLAQ